MFRQHVVDNQKSYDSILKQNSALPPQTKGDTFSSTADQLVKFVATVAIQIAQPQERENGSVIAGSPNQMPGIRACDVVKRETRPFVFSTKSLSCRSINLGDLYTAANWQ